MGIFITTLVFACLVINGDGLSWFQGCYTDQSKQVGKNGTSVQSNDPPIVACSKLCLNQRYVFVALQKGDNCVCLNSTTALSAVDDDLCSLRCSRVSEDVPVRCGGNGGQWSLYLSAGPYLTSLTPNIDVPTIVTNTSVSLDADLILARYINFTQDSKEEWLKRFDLVWKVDGKSFTANVTGYGAKISSRSLFTFKEAGIFSVELIASNAISSLREVFSVTVVLPRPRDLQILPLNDYDSLPSCVPEKYNYTVIAAFVNTTLSLEVSVTVGIDLTYVLRFGKKGRVLQHFKSSPSCQSPSSFSSSSQCHDIIKDFVFPEAGEYVVAANVSNRYGSIHKNISVVVLEQKLGGVTFNVEDDVYIHKTREPVTFLVTVETTARQHTFLRINFGIGEDKIVSLREQKHESENTTGIQSDDGTIVLGEEFPVILDHGSLGFALTASYGEGCNLRIMFHHTYMLEGTYSPRIYISSTNSFLKMTLKQDLVIQHELSGAKLHYEGTAITNRSTEFALYLHKSSVNLSVIWTICDEDVNSLDNVTGGYGLNHTFLSPGQYKVTAIASNLINSVMVSAQVLVETGVEGLSMDCEPGDFAVISQEIVCFADVSEGSDVLFEWNFKDQSSSQKSRGNQTSMAIHRYHEEGEYPISLMVSNAVSRITATLKRPIKVEKEIENIHFLFPPHHKLVNNTSTFTVHPECDCKVDLQFDFGDGRKEYNITSGRSPYIRTRSRVNPYIYVVAYNFTLPGVYPVTVYAFNNVSQANSSIQVIVQDWVGSFHIEVQGHAVQGQKTVVLAKKKGDILRRKNFIYKWTFPDGQIKTTLIPIAEHTFDTFGAYNVNLTVQNLVDSVSKQQEVEVHERSHAKVHIKHAAIVKTYEEVDFILLGRESVDVITVDYADGDVEQYFNQLSWKHAFSEPGVYEVAATIYGEGGTTTLRSYIAAQEPIRFIHLDGVSAIKIENEDTAYTWTARVTNGSHVIYTWSLNNVAYNSTTDHTYTPDVSRDAGIKSIHVRAENDVSSAEATLNVTVQYPISYIELHTSRVPLATPTNVTATIQGGKNFTIMCNFSDGNTQNISSHNHKGIDIVQLPKKDDGIAPIYRVTFSHVYENIGEYDVMVTANNHFSSVKGESVAVVGLPISGINITTDKGPIVKVVDDHVTVTVTVETGDNLEFVWEMKGMTYRDLVHKPIQNHSSERTSNVTYKFDPADKYRISVNISNSFYHEAIMTTLPFLIHAIEPVTGLSIPTVKTGIALGAETVFEARVLSGSDVVFTFDFGDGTTQLRNATTNLMGLVSAQCVHKYTEVGVYTLKVTATNPLGSISTEYKNPIYVQIPPEESKVMVEYRHCSVFGSVVTLEAHEIYGTNISYDWFLDDETQLVDAGRIVQHQYRTVGKKVIAVGVSNKVGKFMRFAEVDVVYEIQGVNLSVPQQLIGTKEVLEYTALPEPDIGGTSIYYNWTFENSIDGKDITNLPTTKYAFKKPGKKLVTVAATNCASRAVSQPLVIQVMSRVEGLKLRIDGESLVNRTLRFEATIWIGDHLTFTWDFGDGSPPIIGTDMVVTHAFQKLDEYVVNLTAENDLSSDSTTARLFVLENICKPPVLTIIGTNTRNFTFYQNEQVHIEVGVEVNCSISRMVEYQWSFINSTSVKVMPRHTSRAMLQKQSLILPPLALPTGEYMLILMVRMQDTIVYSTSEMNLLVVRSPLKVTIEGGILRTISATEKNVVLDASQSVDPDTHTNKHMKFNWTCFTRDRSLPCFNATQLGQSGISLSSSIIVIPIGYFEKKEPVYLFSLNVSTSDGRFAISDQVIDIHGTNQTLRLKVECHQCRDSWVNANKKLSLRTRCPNCPPDVTYSWNIYVIYYNTRPEAERDDPNKCRHLNNHERLSLKLGNKSKTLTTQSPEDPETIVTTKTSHVASSTVKATTPSLPDVNRGISGGRDNHIDVSHGHHIDLIGILDPEEGHGGGRQLEPVAGGYPLSDPKEAPGGSRLDPVGRVDPVDPGDKDEDRLELERPISLDPSLHITSRDYRHVSLPDDHTFTGLDKQSLVIKPSFLQQNWTYIVRVSAMAKGFEPSYAETHFQVNRSPRKGSCTVKPSFGIEMETVFKVYCQEWQDEEPVFITHQSRPLTYEVGYSATQNGAVSLVYRGASHSIDVRLPAGTVNSNYTVHLSISIRDGFGASTRYCRVPIVVQPRSDAISQQSPVNSSLFYSERDAILQARNHGDDRTKCILIGNIAKRLNRLPSANTTFELWKRRTTRHRFLDILEEIPLRDEVEVIQVAEAMVATTAVSNELTKDSLKRAVDLLESIQRRVEVLYADKMDEDEDMLTLALQVVSSIIGSTEKMPKVPMRLTTKAMAILDKLLKVELDHHSIGEVPIQRSAEFVSILGSHFTPGMSRTFGINGAQFKLPTNMAALTQTVRKSSASQVQGSIPSECYQTQLTTFEKNPFPHLRQQLWKVETDIVALSLSSCSGEDITVANLTDDNLVEIQIPQRKKQRWMYTRHVLEKHQMNLHQFNLSGHNFDHPLHISIQLDPVAGRSFPITVLISHRNPPRPKDSVWKKEFPVDLDNIKIFLPPGTFSHAEEDTYYIGIVDARYNVGRHRVDQVLSRNYTFSLWLGNCLFWNETMRTWSPHGCQLMEQSTAERLHCRCNHLTIFGGHFELVPNSLSFYDAENLFDLNKNPVTIIFVSLIICIYFVLLKLCRQADVHDEKKGGVVYLRDNGRADKQQYEVTIETGFRLGAGSTSKISMIIHGEEGMTETRELFCDDSRPLFERNSRDKFVMTHPDSLGKIKKVQLWHNNSGPSPGWYLSRVLVKDLVTGHVYYFLCEKWFAVEEEDGKVEREIMALDGNIGFSTIFWAKGTQYMSDFHLWGSLLTRPSYSRYTRTQRLTCCLTLVMAYMCLNAMWYKQAKVKIAGEFGLLDVSWQNLTIGAIICAIIIPLNLLLDFLFRRSRVHFPGTEPENLKPAEELAAETQDDNQSTMMYSLLDQSILNWQTIQDWAQKQWLKREQAVRPGPNIQTSIKTTNPQSQQSQTTQSALPVLHTLRKEEETDVASSGFEDSTSQAYSHSVGERNRVQSPSDTPSPTPKPHLHYQREPCNLHASRRVFLPFWCRYVAWTLCAVITIGCAGVTVLYGFRFGRTKSTMWLQSLFFSFTICVFIAQPFLILMTVVYTALCHRRDLCILDHYDDGFYGNTGKHGEVDFFDEAEDLERGVAARQRSRYLRFARPPQEKTLLDARRKVIKEKKTLSLFREGVSFAVMFVVVGVMAYGKDSSSAFHCNQAAKQHFVRSGDMTLSEIKTHEDWFRWSRSSLLDALYLHSVPATPTQPQMLIAPLNSHLIGQVQVRQLRVPEEDCITYSHVPLTASCRYGYKQRQANNMLNSTLYTQPTSYSFPLWGQHSSYHYSGSTVKLSQNRSEASAQLQHLESSGWLDLQTRAVIVEMSLFNTPTNLFTSVNLLVEFPPQGGAAAFPVVMSTTIFRYITYWDNCVLACELLFVVLTMVSLRSDLCVIFNQQKKYFSYLWNYLEITFSVLSLTYIGCFVFRFILVSEIVEEFRNSFYEEFVNISFLAVWDEILRSLVGMVFFFVIVKSLPVLSYAKACSKYRNIYKRARKELVIFLALFVVLLCAFTSLGVALFGSVSLGFRNLWFGLFSVTALMTRVYSHSHVEHPDTPWWPVFVIFYLVFGVGLLTSFMVAAFTRRLKVYKHGEIPIMETMEGIKFLTDKFLLWSGIRRLHMTVEDENVLPPEFAMAEIEYQVDELLFRMNNLTRSSGLPEKPPGYLTDSTDTSHGAGDDGISSGGSEEHAVMDVNRLGHRVQKIEDKLCANEPYLAQLIKLDSIGADVLSQEKEKQLRSHLELEVFRHLQMQRSESTPIPKSPSNPMPVLMTTLYGSSMEESPPSGSNGSHKTPLLDLPKLSLIGNSDEKSPANWPQGSKILSPISTTDLQKEPGSSSPESPHAKRPCDTRSKVKVKGPPLPPKPTMKQLLGKGNGKSSKPSSSSENASPQSSESEKRHRRTDSSSGHSGSVERGGSLKRPSVKPELPPKPTFIQTALKEQSHRDSTKSLSSSQKPKQFKLPPERVLQKGDNCGNIAAESSSGSEQDTSLVGRRPSGKRNLRKTKSRGKGKGSGSLSPALMLEDLNLDSPEGVDVRQVEVLVHQEQQL